MEAADGHGRSEKLVDAEQAPSTHVSAKRRASPGAEAIGFSADGVLLQRVASFALLKAAPRAVT
jgi:hypothetical protein